MEHLKMKLTGSETLLDGGTILLYVTVADNPEPISIKLDRYLGTGTPDHLYLGGKCLKPYSETEKRIVDAIEKHINGELDRDELKHTGSARLIVEACRKEGRVAPFGFDDRDHYNTTDTLVGAVALLIGRAISKGKTLEKIDGIYSKLEDYFQMGKKKPKPRRKKK